MKLKLIALGLLATTSIASAADLPARTYTKAPIVSPAYNWTGFYIGAMGGYGWSDSQGMDLKGGFAGGTLGYNWQGAGSPWVFGIEAEGAWSDIGQTAGIVGLLTVGTKIEGFGSVSGRIGYAFDNVLVYGKGGVGFASNEVNVAVLGVNFNDSKTHVGYSVGAGVEVGFARNWSVKAEYLYAGYGSEDYFVSTAGFLRSGDIEVQTVKVGLNYRFGAY